jgi:hypothetical protein
MPSDRFPELAFRAAGYRAVWHGQKSWNGVAILARGRDPIERRRALPGDPDDEHSRYIEASVGDTVVACLYLPNGNPAPGPRFDYKLRWLDRLIAHGRELLASERAVLTGDFNEWFSLSYYCLFAYRQISDSWRYDENGNHSPRNFGTSASPLMQKIDGSHHSVRLSDLERQRIQLWIESGATYAGTYAGFNEVAVAVSGARMNSPTVVIDKPLGPIVERRCYTCHGSAANLGQRHTKGRINLPKHCWKLYNLSHPEKSMILRAPLAKAAGGYAWCKTKDGQPASVFADVHDAEYQAILKAIESAKSRQEELKRYDMPGFRPNEHYVHWMKRFGALPETFDPAKDPIDPYQTDQAYWRSLWYRPL